MSHAILRVCSTLTIPSVRITAPSLLAICLKHYRKRLICRVPNSLPCAKRRADDKQPLCRVPKIKHTANTTHTAKFPLCHVTALGTHGKNQTHGILLSLLCAVLKTHGKPRARATHVRRWRTEGRRRLTALNFSVCRMGHTANRPLRRVLLLGIW